MDNIHENIDEYNPNKKRQILIVFDDMITDMLSDKNYNPIKTELFIRVRKLIIVLFYCTENIRLNSKQHFIIKTSNKLELKQIAINHLSDIDFKYFMNLYKKDNAKPYSLFVNDTTPALGNLLRFRCNLLKRI